MLTAQAPSPAPNGNVMIVGVAHDNSVMGGGISSSNFLKPGDANVEPIAWLTPSGDWQKVPCYETGTPYDPPSDYSGPCLRFAREYLNKPHSYTVVSADGRGASVVVPFMDLDHECFGMGGDGKFSGATIRSAAVAAESAAMFSPGEPARRMIGDEAAAVRKGLALAAGDRLDSTKELRVYSVSIEGRHLVVIQRAFQDYADKPEYQPPNSLPEFKLIFAIGEMRNGRFHLLHWKEETDENEQILGLVHMKNGRDFLVSASSDPEGGTFRVYGIRDGKLVMVFEGGGGAC